MKDMGHRKSAPSLAPNKARSFCGQQLKYRTRIRHHQRCRWIRRRQIRDGRNQVTRWQQESLLGSGLPLVFPPGSGDRHAPRSTVKGATVTALRRRIVHDGRHQICFWVRFLPRILQWVSEWQILSSMSQVTKANKAVHIWWWAAKLWQTTLVFIFRCKVVGLNTTWRTGWIWKFPIFVCRCTSSWVRLVLYLLVPLPFWSRHTFLSLSHAPAKRVACVTTATRFTTCSVSISV